MEDTEHPIDAHYRKLQTHIVPLERDSDEHKIIEVCVCVCVCVCVFVCAQRHNSSKLWRGACLNLLSLNLDLSLNLSQSLNLSLSISLSISLNLSFSLLFDPCQEYTANTHAPTHSSYQLKIEQV